MRDIYFYNTNLYTGTSLDQFAAAKIVGILSDKYHLCNLGKGSTGKKRFLSGIARIT